MQTQVDLICYQCKQIFKRPLKRYTDSKRLGQTKLFCSHRCRGLHDRNQVLCKCTNCDIEISIKESRFKKRTNHFCSQHCFGIYNQKHPKYYDRSRSKLEKYIEIQLKSLYKDLDIKFNDTKTINSELDIYIPSLKLAFELNGIFHYEPIYGQDKLKKVKNNDNRKFQACLEHKIELCIIDTTIQKYFKESTSQIYLEIITSLINSKLLP